MALAFSPLQRAFADAACPANQTAYGVQVTSSISGCIGGNFNTYGEALAYVQGVSCTGQYGATFSFAGLAQSGLGDQVFSIVGSGPNGSYQGTGDIIYSCQAAACTTPAGGDLGEVKSTGFYNPNGSPVPDANEGDFACVNSCQAQAGKVLDMTAAANGHTVETLDWESTGISCQAGATTHTPQPLNNGVDCALDSSGIQTCAGPAGVIGDDADLIRNGVDIGPSVVQQLKNDACVTVPSGATVCTTSFTNQPDIGIPGQQATPTATVTVSGPDCPSGNLCVYNYYGESVTASSTNYGTGAPQGQCPVGIPKMADGTCGTTATCPSGQSKNAAGMCTASMVGGGSTTGTTGGTTGSGGGGGGGGSGTCGGPGQPDCNVKVDETGVPTTAPNLGTQYGDPAAGDGGFSAAQTLINKNPFDPANGGVGAGDITGPMGIPLGEGSCQAVSLQMPSGRFWSGQSMTILDSAHGCAAFQAFRDWSGWILGVAVIFALASRFLSQDG